MFLSPLSCSSALLVWAQKMGEWRTVLLWPSAANVILGEIIVFCIFSPKCDRLKVTRAGPEITVTEYNPCTGRLKKEKQTAHCVCMEMGEELLGNHRISKCI